MKFSYSRQPCPEKKTKKKKIWISLTLVPPLLPPPPRPSSEKNQKNNNNKNIFLFLAPPWAEGSRGAYSMGSLRRPSVVHPHFQTTYPLKPLGQM